eukprot:6471718-Amphidinium_carterae.2
MPVQIGSFLPLRFARLATQSRLSATSPGAVHLGLNRDARYLTELPRPETLTTKQCDEEDGAGRSFGNTVVQEPEPAPEEPQPELTAEERKRVLRSLQRSHGRTTCAMRANTLPAGFW